MAEMIKEIDVSVLVNLHAEGLIAYPTLRSVNEAVLKATEKGIGTEVILLLDNPDAETESLVGSYAERFNFQCHTISYKDLGLSRNHGIEIANGKYLTFIDGDDLWGEDWIWRCFELSESREDDIVIHPEVNVIFGKENHLFFHTDMESTEFDLDFLRINNYWTALSFSKKSVYQATPYAKNKIKEGFGFEDWNWNCRTIKKNIVHKTAKHTCHFIRKKEEGSMLQDTNKNYCLVTPNDLFSMKDN